MSFLDEIKTRIALEGPLPVERYMALCLAYYYGSRDPLGSSGDFTTAPEISQMFGELLGLWSAEVWRSMGAPHPVRLIELGPGRGTLMADALRAARVAPGFLEAIDLHLVETSLALRARQRERLSGLRVPTSWHDRIESVPEGPCLVLANEFFDALPVRQFVATEAGWHERCVGLEADGLAFGLVPAAAPPVPLPTRPGAVLEWPAAAIAVARRLGRRIVASGGAALIIDYGHWGPAFGDTLQAVRQHAFVDPLAEPGEADLTVHVDFHRLAEAAGAEGAAVHGPAPQGDFLQALGIGTRARALQARSRPEQARSIAEDLARLTGTGPGAMGTLFKVLGLSHPGLPALPGLTLAGPPPRPEPSP